MVGLPALEDLELSETKITNRGLDFVRQLTTLRTLSLANTTVTPAGLAKLDALKQLHTLWVVGIKMDDKTLAELRSRLPGVQIMTHYSMNNTFEVRRDDDEAE